LRALALTERMLGLSALPIVQPTKILDPDMIKSARLRLLTMLHYVHGSDGD
jgi:hypothetical protein